MLESGTMELLGSSSGGSDHRLAWPHGRLQEESVDLRFLGGPGDGDGLPGDRRFIVTGFDQLCEEEADSTHSHLD